MKTEDNKKYPALENASNGKDLDQLRQLYHKALWQSIDQLARDHNLTITGLAKKSGVDFKLITPSKRETEKGLHWPSLSTLNRLYAAVNKPVPFTDNEGKAILLPQVMPQDQCKAIEALTERHDISFPKLSVACGLSDNFFLPCRKNKDRSYAYETSVFARPFILLDEIAPFLTKKLSEMTDAELAPIFKAKKPKEIKEPTKAVKPKTEKSTSSPEKVLPEKTVPSQAAKPVQEPDRHKEKEVKVRQRTIIAPHKKAGVDWIEDKTEKLTEDYTGDYLVQIRETTYTVAHEAWKISPSTTGDKEEPGKEVLDTLLKHNIANLRLQKFYQFCKFDITNVLACTKAIQYGLKDAEEIMETAVGYKAPRFSVEMIVDDVRKKDPNFAPARP